MILLTECVAACILFTLVVVAVSLKDPLAQVNNWPPAIQQRARELGLIREEQMSGSKKVYAKKLAVALVIAIAFAALVFFANGARSFVDGFGYSYLIWTVVNWYDALVIDCLWVCHDPGAGSACCPAGGRFDGGHWAVCVKGEVYGR